MHLPSDSDTDRDFVVAGDKVDRGQYRCTDCGFRLEVGASRVPHCPLCKGPEWEILVHYHED